MNIPAILNYLRPGEEWALDGDTYAGLIWLSKTTKPTENEINDAWPTVENQLNQSTIKNDRHNAYVAEADPLFFGWQRGENTEQSWLDKVAEIRARYPYPA